MAKDFSAIINEAKSKHESEAADQAAEEAVRRAKSDAEFDRSVRFLNAAIIPVIEEAARQLAKEGYPLNIKKNWEGPGKPIVCNVTIQLDGPSKKNRMGGISTPKSVVYVFYHDGNKFTVGFGSTEYSSHADTKRTASESDIELEVDKAIEKVLDTYLAKVSEYRRQGMWD